VELLTDLHIFGCKSHKSAFGSWASSGPAGRAIELPQTLAVIGRREGENGLGIWSGGREVQVLS